MAGSIPATIHDAQATERPSAFYNQRRMNPKRTVTQIDLTYLSTESDHLHTHRCRGLSTHADTVIARNALGRCSQEERTLIHVR